MSNERIFSQRDKAVGEPSPAGLSGRDARFPQPHRPPLYTAHNLHPSYSLRYDWTGWPTDGTVLPPTTTEVARAAASAWELDGLRLLESHATMDKVQLLFTATPQVSPVFCCQRVKGRLQHAFCKADTPVDFSRKVSFRTLGENTDGDVAGYIRKQVDKERFADPRFEAIMRQFTVTCPDVALAEPSESNSGRYWYNLHLVLVVDGRFRITNPEKLGQLRDTVFTVAGETRCRIAALSVMPDHIHTTLRGNIERSPEDIALAFQNGLARALGCRAWQAKLDASVGEGEEEDATMSKPKDEMSGECFICHATIPKAKATQHVKACLKARHHGAGRPVKAMHLLIEGRYNSEYWMHIEIASATPLYNLDAFLRQTWLECCQHMSCFTIDDQRYAFEPYNESLSGGREKSMDSKLYKVVSPGAKFTHEYDYGSTTDLALRAFESTLADAGIRILARNTPPHVLCGECGKPATIVEAGYGSLNPDRCFCKKCAASKIEEGMRLPIVNSPRVGVCAYCG